MKKILAQLNLIKRFFSYIFIFLFLSLLLYPKTLRSETLKIIDIKVENNNRISSSTILSYIKTKIGDDYDPDILREDLEAIYDSGLFININIDKKVEDEGVVITFIVSEKPVIKQIIFNGNKKLTTENLKKEMTIKENQLFSTEEIVKNISIIKNLYSKEDYYIAEVDYEIKDLSENAVEVVFNIKENTKVLIKKINFIGNDSFSDEKLKNIIETTEGELFSSVNNTGSFKEEVFEVDIEKIKKFYKENGFVKVEVKPAKTSLSPDKKNLFLTILINEGKIYRIGTIEIQGEDLIFSKEELDSSVTLKQGEIFNETKLFNDIITLTDKYTNMGYAYANVYPYSDEDEKNQKINLIINIKKNELVYINTITITGNKSTRDKVIRRQLKISEGDLYNKEKIIKSREQVYYLAYFEEVNILTKKPAPDKIDLEINVKEKTTGTINVGAGYSSHDKLMGFASISKGNFLGLDETIRIETQLSSKRQTYNLSFTEPWLFDKPLSFSINLYNSRKEYTNYLKKSKGGSIRFGYPLFEEVKGFIRYKNEIVEITDLEEGVSAIIAEQEGTTRTSSVDVTLQRDTRNHRFDPSKGSLNSINIEYAGGALLSGDNYFTKYSYNGSKYFNPWFEHVFMMHMRTSYAHGNEGRELPIYERYYLGGINSLRGFDYNSVGPKDPITGDVIGGDKEILFNFEYSFFLVKEANFKFLVFYDIGNAFAESDDIKLSELRKSVGYGIRWISPMGPLRLEWGYNLEPEPGEKKSQWEFTIGTFF